MTSPYEHPAAKEILDPELIPYAVGVGALCQKWARLESAVRMLFLKVSGMPIDRTSFGLVHCFDIRDHLAAIKLAFVDKTADRPKVTDFALETIDYIDSVLRPRRNRYVHDIWNYDYNMESVERVTYAPRIFKPQSRQPRKWAPSDFHPENLDDLWATVSETQDHTSLLVQLQSCFDGDDDAFQKLLQSPPQRQFQRRQGGTPRPKGTAKPKQKPPHRSSHE